MGDELRIALTELHVPLKTTFRHASAARKEGESIWVEAARGDLRGYGEGCQRPYVTGETIASCRQWADPHLADIRESCASLAALNAWAERNAASIDEGPSAWCAIEGSLPANTVW